MFAGVTTHYYTFADEAEYLSMSNGVDLTVPVPRYVPAEVQMRQARLALMRAGNLAAVETALTAMTGVTGEAARIEWQYSNTIKRNQPLVLSLGAVLGLTPTQLDDLFLLAESI